MPKDETGKVADPRLNTVIFLCTESLRISGIMLQPYMPDKAALLLDMLGVDEKMRGLEYARVGKDFTYGTPKVDLGKGPKGVLFAPLLSDE
jgi:methionyl-tRNA synthetase